MKKTIMSVLCLGALASAQAFTVGTPVRIETGAPAHNPVLSQDGTKVLFSADDFTGLKAIDLTTQAITTIDDARGAGFDARFSLDGSKVVYRTAILIDGMMNRDVREYNFAEDTRSTLCAPSRQTIATSELAGETGFAMADGKTIRVFADGYTKDINPLSEAHSYLWASMSPDGSRVLFNEPFRGVFVANADGSNAVCVAPKGDFPAWVGNNTISYVVSHDDGYVILDATLIVADLTSGDKTAVTEASTLVGEAAATNGTIVFTTVDGEMFKIAIR